MPSTEFGCGGELANHRAPAVPRAPVVDQSSQADKAQNLIKIRMMRMITIIPSPPLG